jgi:60 kDa SS-A/Ro ribonucleoprotein
VCVDVSGSMRSPVTGTLRGSTTAVQCVDVAALMAACVLRTNDEAEVIVFSSEVHEGTRLNPRDAVLTNAQRMASEPAGGTNCSSPLAKLNREGRRGDLVIMLSDYESWMDPSGRTIRMGNAGQDGTAMMREWMAFRARNPGARLACVDLQPTATVQAINREDIVNFGGFSDEVFTVLESAARGELSPTHWTDRVERVGLEAA